MSWNPGFLALGAALLLGALGCLWLARKFRREIALMAATQTSRAADVAKLAPGTLVEVKGTIRCDAPIQGEFSELPCVYAKSQIERIERRRRDGQDDTTYTTESCVERHAPFFVEDASGRVLVRGEGASVESKEVYNQSGRTATESLVSLGVSLLGGGYERRYTECILAPDTEIYVLGTVGADGAIAAAPKGAAVKNFIITHQSEEQRAKASRIWSIAMVVVAVVLAAGAVAMVYGAYLHRTPPAG